MPQDLSTMQRTTTTMVVEEGRNKNTTTLLSKILMGFAVLLLVGVLMRLIQLRAKRVRQLELNEQYQALMQSGGTWSFFGPAGCCFLPIAVCFIIGGVVMAYIIFHASRVQQQQERTSAIWNLILGFLLLVALVFVLQHSKVLHSAWSSSDIPGAGDDDVMGVGAWGYFAVALAALAAAKITSNILRSPAEIHHHRTRSQRAEDSWFGGSDNRTPASTRFPSSPSASAGAGGGGGGSAKQPSRMPTKPEPATMEGPSKGKAPSKRPGASLGPSKPPQPPPSSRKPSTKGGRGTKPPALTAGI